MIPQTGRLVEVWQKGEGPDLVFLHGAGGLPAWGPDLELLSQSFRVTVPFHPGFGKSTGVESIDGVLDSVLHNFDVLSALKISKPHLIGHSMGGMLAAEMAATCPNDVGKVVLIAPVGLWDDAHPILDFFAVMPQEISKYVFHSQKHPMAVAMSTLPSPDDERIVDVYVNYVKGLAAAGRLLWPIPDRGLSKRIHRISAPTLVLWGESDKLVPVFYAKEFGKRIAGARIKVVKEASHMVPIEQPRHVATAITQFLLESAKAAAKGKASSPVKSQSAKPTGPKKSRKSAKAKPSAKRAKVRSRPRRKKTSKGAKRQ